MRLKNQLVIIVVLLALVIAPFAFNGCATSARKSFVAQGSPQAQKLADLLGEAQTKTLDGAQKFFETKLSHQQTDVASWKSDAETKGTFNTPANQFFYAQLLLGIQDTQNKLKFIADLKAEAATVPTAPPATP